MGSVIGDCLWSLEEKVAVLVGFSLDLLWVLRVVALQLYSSTCKKIWIIAIILIAVSVSFTVYFFVLFNFLRLWFEIKKKTMHVNLKETP